jgi:hypothetical protein
MSKIGPEKRPRHQNPAADRSRRKIYIKERLPAVAAEMKTLTEERKELLAKRKEAQPDERKESNRRWHFIVERLEVLRSERAALMGERDGMPSQLAHTQQGDEPE